MTQAELIQCIHRGILHAAKTYYEWTGGEMINYRAGEGFIVSNVAQFIMSLKDNPPAHLFLEYPIESILENANPIRGPKPIILQGGRVDIAITNAEFYTQFVIEIKSTTWNERCELDFNRMSELYDRLINKQGDTRLRATICAPLILSCADSQHNAEQNLEINLEKWQDRYTNLAKINKVNISFDVSTEKLVFTNDPRIWAMKSLCVMIKN